MEYFNFNDIIISFLILVFYIIVFYLIIKQLYRNFSFGDTIIYMKNKNINQKYTKWSLFINVTLIIIYLIVIYKNMRLDINTSMTYGYYDSYINMLPIKISLSLIPLFIFILINVCNFSKNRITTKGIVGDKFAFIWDEIQNVEKNDEILKIYYKYKILFININLIYKIDDIKRINEIYKIIDTNIINNKNN